MPKLRPDQKQSKAKKLTKEVLRKDPLLAALIRARAKEIRAIRDEKKAWELKLD